MKTLKTIGFIIVFFISVHYIFTPLVGGIIWLTGAVSSNIHRQFQNGWNWSKENIKD